MEEFGHIDMLSLLTSRRLGTLLVLLFPAVVSSIALLNLKLRLVVLKVHY